jgi:dipeptide/tripeptide permease
MCGNLGSAISPTLLAYLMSLYGWNVPFMTSSVLCIVAALLFLRIDATRQFSADPANSH